MDRSFKNFIQNSPLFNHIAPETLNEVVELFEYRRLLRGETLFQINDPGDAFYILLSGRLQVIQGRPVAELLPGDSFGELALLSNKPRSATIRAQRDSELGRLHKDHFEMILKNHPEVAVEIIKVMGSWLDLSEPGLPHRIGGIFTCIELTSDPLCGEVLDDLVAQLTLKRTTHCFSTQHLPAQFLRRPGSKSEDDIANGNFNDEMLSRWISEKEQQGHFVLLACSPQPSQWRDFCLRQADRIMLLAMSEQFELKTSPPASPPGLPPPERDLILIHRTNAARPQNTSKWLTAMELNRHHHIRRDIPGDIERLAREISHEANAVVLGGGGARSFAQIGVLKAMESLGISVDRIAGTSMGAIIAAQYADGYSPDEMLALNNDIWVKNKPHKAFTLPVSSLLTAGRAKRLTQNVFGERDIEDLWLDFFCVSSDLTRLDAMRHQTGKIWSALLASGAIPGICSSIISEEGSLLVDGGLIDNLPVAAMRDKHNGRVIAIDVASDKGLLPHWQDTIPPNGLSALWHHINPFKKDKPHPHIFKLFTHTATLASKMNSEHSRKLADLCIMPNCSSHGLMQMSNLESLVSRGYESAMPILENWLSDL